jgi:hypothetical protein
MITDEDLNGIDGWLLIYVALRYIGAVVATVLVVLLFRTATMNGHPLNHATLLLLLLGAIGSLTGATAATAVLRTSLWALQLVGLDLLYASIALVISVIVGFAIGADPQRFPLGSTVGQIAALWTWFQYFRVSQRVHATFGRNLLEDAVEPV